ncbi:MAG: PEGA domain-containing protein [Myxococcota bacterium]
MMRILSGALVVLLCIFSGPAVAVCEVLPELDDLSDAERATLMTSLEQGRAAYESGQFEPALGAFERAYRVFPHPDVLYRLAECQEKLGRDADAVKNYSTFLRQVPGAPERKRIEGVIAVLTERMRAVVKVRTVPEGAAVRFAGAERGTSPVDIPAMPGVYTVELVLDGYAPIREQITVEEGTNVVLRYTMSAASGEQSPPKKLTGSGGDSSFVAIPGEEGAPRTVRSRVLRPVTDRDRYFIGAAALGGAAALVTGGLLFRWASAADQVANFDAQRDALARPPEYTDLVRRRNRAGGFAAVTTIVSFGALGAATYLHLGSERPNLVWAPWIVPGDGAGAQVSVQF